MSARAKTIQIFLPSGDPRGIRVAEITTRIVQVIEIPRSLLTEYLTMPESQQVALYFLFGSSDDGEPRVYLGQTGDQRQRLTSHHKSKDFWERALVLISRTNSLTQTHAMYLEWHCIQEATRVGRYSVENGNAGTRPHTPAPLRADCVEVFETGQVLLATLGYPIFEALGPAAAQAPQEDVYVCIGSDADGRGLYTQEGFVVLKGSSGRKIPGKVRAREGLLESGVLAVRGERVIFTRDHLFGSPSRAASALMARAANGWQEWRMGDGRTLDEVKRVGDASGGAVHGEGA
jgi:hypothetical protein